MVEAVSGIKQRPLTEWFKSTVSAEAINLVSRMLQFNPEKRITINELLKSPYLSQFSNPKE